MRELVGRCARCQKELYCIDGFFQGEISDSGKIFCLSCFEERKKELDLNNHQIPKM